MHISTELDNYNRFVEDPKLITLQQEHLNVVKQFYQLATKKENVSKNTFLIQKKTLRQFYTIMSYTRTIIFCNSRRNVDNLCEVLKLQTDLQISSFHGGMDGDRKSIIDNFLRGSTGILITTDAYARSNYPKTAPLIINFDLPRDISDYIHR